MTQKYNEMRLLSTGSNFSALGYSNTPDGAGTGKKDLFQLTSFRGRKNHSIDMGSLKNGHTLQDLIVEDGSLKPVS
jgi:hypothetical protein